MRVALRRNHLLQLHDMQYMGAITFTRSYNKQSCTLRWASCMMMIRHLVAAAAYQHAAVQ
jgi:hypothetical protein